MVGKGKRKIVEAKDRLSTLPDEVLCHILSLLITKEAVSTSVLSTRWRNLYTYVTVLRFGDYSIGTEVACGKFAEFIKGVFSRHVSDISFFRLALASGPYDNFDVVSWINASIRRNVQKLKVISLPEAVSRCPIPTEIFTCKTLVDLKLWSSFVFNVPEIVYLPNLKKCSFCGSIEFVNNSSGRLFLSFPKLEKLTLKNCNLGNIMDLELHLPLLKVVRFSMLNGDGANKILLDAPNVERIQCYYHKASVLFKDAVKFICRADVGFNQESCKFAEEATSELLGKINQVKYLSLCMDLRKIWLLPMFNNLTHLVIKGTCKWLPELLHRSPCLEVLVIHEGFIDDDADAQISECEPLCLSRQLKVVKVNVTRLDQAEFKSVGILLKIAKVLERLIVYLEPLDRNKEIYSFEHRCQVLQKLLALPRESKTCQVEITHKYFHYGHMF